MKYSINSSSITKQKTDCLILSITSDKALPLLKELDAETQKLIKTLISQEKISTQLGQCTVLIHTNPTLLLVGIGKDAILTTDKIDLIATNIANELKKINCKTASLFVDGFLNKNIELSNFLSGLMQQLSDEFYTYHHYKKSMKQASLNEVKFVVDTKQEKAAKAVIHDTNALIAGIELTKDLVNGPCNLITPKELAQQADALAVQYKSIKTKTLDTKAMQKLNMNALLAVGQGSHEPSYFVTLEYTGGKKSDKPIVLVGKGVTFDTGGISLKPGAGMDEMKTDMGGAATVLGVLRTVAELKLPINVVGLIPTVVNMPDGKSYKPGDILTSMSGVTIEVLNTDAEGRLILCDALTYAKRYEPDTIIDMATLTGAMVIALGEVYQGVFTRQDHLAEELLTAAKEARDKTWRMPLDDAYQKLIDSKIADIKNTGGRNAGSITAACFLSRFVEHDQPWAHIDIAGTASKGGNSVGATGRPVPLLVRYLKNKVSQ